MVVTIQLTGRCNLRCEFCLDEYKKCCEGNISDFEEIIDYLKFLQIKEVNLTGGEPLLYREFAQVVYVLYENQIAVNVFTNGILIDSLERQVLNKINSFSISIDAASRNISKIMSRGSYQYTKAIENIIYIKKNYSHIKINVASVISKINKDDIIDLGKILISLNVDSWQLRQFRSIRNESINNSYMIDDISFNKVVTIIQEKYTNLTIKVLRESQSYRYLHITPDYRKMYYFNNKQKELHNIYINDNLRIRNFTHQEYKKALPWYQHDEILLMSEGQNERKYSIDDINQMYNYLNDHGDLYFIEVYVNNNWVTIGDVCLKEEVSICIGDIYYHSKGIGFLVMSKLIELAKERYIPFLTATVYPYNQKSKQLFEKLGFNLVLENEEKLIYKLDIH